MKIKMNCWDFFLCLFAIFLCATNYPVSKTMTLKIPPLFFMGLRLLIGGCLLLFWSKKQTFHNLNKIFSLSITQHGLNFGLFILGLCYVGSSIASIISLFEVPFTALLAAFFLNEKMSFLTLLGILTSFIGATIISFSNESLGSPFGIFLLLMAALIYSYSCIQAKKIEADSISITALSSLFGSLQLFTASFFSGEVISSFQILFNGPSLLSIIYLSISSSISFLILIYLFKRYALYQIMSFIFIIPLIGAISGVMFFNEHLDLHFYIGGFLILLGVMGTFVPWEFLKCLLKRNSIDGLMTTKSP